MRTPAAPDALLTTSLGGDLLPHAARRAAGSGLQTLNGLKSEKDVLGRALGSFTSHSKLLIAEFHRA
jgi:hypothetical protein